MKKKIIKILNFDKSIVIKEDSKRIRPAKSEVDRLCCDNKKILEKTSWKPSCDLDVGLKETIEWFKKNNNFIYIFIGGVAQLVRASES